jgi:predicted amidohydrolase
MKIAALQTVSGTSMDANLANARTLLAQAAQQGAELAVLPEYFCLMGHREQDKLAAREAFGSGQVQAFLADSARQLGLWIVGGTLPLVAQSEAHWELLLRARAVENLAYVCAPAQGGRHENGRRTWGHSMVVDPWGSVLAVRAEEGAGVVLADISVERLAQVRKQLPALDHRIL